MVAQKLMTSEAKGGKLPPVLPIVLYNGEGAWTAAEEMRDLVYPVEGLDIYIPNCRYLLLDEQRYTDEQLESAQKNLVAALFRLEKSRTAADIREVVDRLVTWLKEPEQAGIRRAFAVWLRRVLLPARLKDVEVPEVSDLGEVRTMLEERVIQWTKEWKQQGLEQGLSRGKAESLLAVLEARGLTVTDDKEATIRSCRDLETLDRWLRKAAKAESLDEIFE
jgi:ribosomal protein L17